MEKEVSAFDPSGYWIKRFPNLPFVPLPSPVTKNQVQLFVDQGEFFPEFIRMIDEVKETLSFQFLNWEADEGGEPIAKALIRAAKRGVRVRGILDSLCMIFETNGQMTIWPHAKGRTNAVRSERSATKKLFREMKGAGIEFAISFPSFKNGFTRNHRKSIVADGTSALVGGFNPTAHNRAWHEICVRIDGAAANTIEHLWSDVVKEEGIRPFGSPHVAPAGQAQGAWVGIAMNDPRNGIAYLDFLRHFLSSARHTVRLENAYLTDPRVLDLLSETASRGVTVQVIVPAQSNHLSVDKKRDRKLNRLKSSGVDVFLYPRMSHAKVTCVDDLVLAVGSANLTPLNLNTEREMDVIAFDETGKLGASFVERVFFPDLKASLRL